MVNCWWLVIPPDSPVIHISYLVILRSSVYCRSLEESVVFVFTEIFPKVLFFTVVVVVRLNVAFVVITGLTVRVFLITLFIILLYLLRVKLIANITCTH